MSDTVENKRLIRDVVSLISKKFSTNFHEVSIIGNLNGRKYHGVSEEKDMCIFVCTNSLIEGKIKAGQRSAIFEKCYWLSIGKHNSKILIFTDEGFHNKFLDEYSDYLCGIETMYFMI